MKATMNPISSTKRFIMFTIRILKGAIRYMKEINSSLSRRGYLRHRRYRSLFVVVCTATTLLYVLFGVIEEYSYFPDTAYNHDFEEDMDTDTNESNGLQYAIFYNAYINPRKVALSVQVISEQLAQWQGGRHANATLYYTHLGKASTPFPCPKHGRCRLLDKKRRGEESVTLENLYGYCQKYPYHNVIYLHSKGTFHPSKENHSIRKVLTASALSDQCHEGLTNRLCNVCSARFAPLPHWHTPGNMWTAHCSYIQKLIPILQFEPKVAKIVKQSEYQYAPPFVVGTDRFANEHWVHTHPDVYPCDVYPDINWLDGYKTLDDTLPLELFVKAPRAFKIPKSGKVPLSYRLNELQQLYNATPANDSFVWTWYTKANLL